MKYLKSLWLRAKQSRTGLSVAAVLALGLLSSTAQAVPFAMPAEMTPDAIATTVFGIVSPFIPTIVTIAATLMVSLLVYRVIVRKVSGFGNA